MSQVLTLIELIAAVLLQHNSNRRRLLWQRRNSVFSHDNCRKLIHILAKRVREAAVVPRMHITRTRAHTHGTKSRADGEHASLK